MYQGPHKPREEKVRDPGAKHPFKHANKMQGLVNAAMQIYPPGSTDLRLALEAIGPYKPRGGVGKHRTKNRLITGRWAQDRSKYSPHQGPTECARRMFQQAPKWVRDETRAVLEGV